VREYLAGLPGGIWVDSEARLRGVNFSEKLVFQHKWIQDRMGMQKYPALKSKGLGSGFERTCRVFCFGGRNVWGG
jgi:hypothetical protein